MTAVGSQKRCLTVFHMVATCWTVSNRRSIALVSSSSDSSEVFVSCKEGAGLKTLDPQMIWAILVIASNLSIDIVA